MYYSTLQCCCTLRLTIPILGRSLGLVMGGDSSSKGHGFESRRRILDGHNIFSRGCPIF